MDEFSRIQQLLAPIAHQPEALGLQDDAAWFQPPVGYTLVATADALVEGIHFMGTEPAAWLAQKALRVNLSDIAAMGAEPYGYLLTLQLPERCNDAWLADFARGLAEDQARYGLRLWGGDSSRAAQAITLSVTALGLLPADVAPLRRNGARVGDAVVVGGYVGAGALGLQRLQQGAPMDMADACVVRYLCPEPRLALGQALRGIATAAVDVSDGVWQDAGHIARASGVGIVLDAAALPLPPHCAATEAHLHAALSGGDDYELLFTLPPEEAEDMALLAQTAGVALTRIGTVVADAQGTVQLRMPDGMAPPPRRGWMHQDR